MQCYGFSKFKKLSRLLMSISFNEFDSIAKNIKFSTGCQDVDLPLTKTENVHFSILSEIFELLNILDSGHLHYDCTNDSSLSVVKNSDELWKCLYDIADKKCKRT
jgi:hypothetical protein